MKKIMLKISSWYQKQKNTDITDINNKKWTGYQTALQNRIKGLKTASKLQKITVN